TGPGSATTAIGAGVVGNSNLTNVPAFTFKGNNTANPAAPLDLTIAQTRTLLTIPISVTDPAFGAKCDGVTNDTTAIQAAITAAQSAGATAGTVLLPGGVCIVSGSVVNSAGSVHIKGAGRNATFVRTTSATADVFQFNGSAFDSSISNLTIGSVAGS